MPRFLNVVFVLVFSTVSALLQHSLTKKVMNQDFFRVNRKDWSRRYIKLKKKKSRVIKKVVNRSKYWQFMFTSMFANLVQLLPIFIVLGLFLGGITENTLDKNFQKYFFGVALLIKYVAWHLTWVISWLFVFRRTPRLRLDRI